MKSANRFSQRTKLSQKKLAIIAAGSLLLFIITGALIVSGVFVSKDAVASVTGDYRSSASGNWNNILTWQRFNGTTWVAAAATPTNADGEITIRNGYTVTVTAGVTADQVIVESGGQLTLSNGTFGINDGTGNDLTLDGSLTIGSTLTLHNSSSFQLNGSTVLITGGNLNFQNNSSLAINNGGRYRKDGGSQTNTAGYWTVNSGGTYQHNDDGTNMPNAVWNNGSTCEVTGVVSYVPGNLDQSFYNFNWNCPGQAHFRNLSSALTTINGDLRVVSTGTGGIKMSLSSNKTLTIGGNYYHEGGTVSETEGGGWTITLNGSYIQTGGNFVMTDATSSSAAGTPTFNVLGNFTVAGGTFYMSQYSGSNVNDGIGTLNVYGDFSFSGGTITETAVNVGRGEINFVKSGTQLITGGGSIINNINYTVFTGSTLNLGTTALTGNGTFTMQSSSGLMLGSSQGISISGATGNIQSSGTRSFSTTGYYTYNGASGQISGNGLPSVISTLTINNASGVVLTSSANATSTITFQNGNVTTNANVLTLGSSALSTGTLVRTSGYVIGNFKRWIAASAISNILFPVGTNAYYEGMNLNYTSAPSAGGTLTSSFIPVNPGCAGLNLNDAGVLITTTGAYGYWQFIPANGITGGTYLLDLTSNGFVTVNDYTALRIIYRNDAASNWTLRGTHVSGTGNNSNPIAHRTAVTSYAQYGLGGNVNNPLPVELISFVAKVNDDEVRLFWETASEKNNDYFTIERSANANDFITIGKVPSAGNGTNAKAYALVDREPLYGMAYYRLKQTDYNGKFSYSKICSVNFENNSTEKSTVAIENIYPNPFTDHFTIQYHLSSPGTVEIELANVSGILIQKKIVEGNEGVNRFEFVNADFNKGVYFVNVKMNGEAVSKKVIKK